MISSSSGLGGKRWLSGALLLLVAGVFIIAGGLKLLDPVGTVLAIDQYQLTGWAPRWLVALLAFALPSLEVCTGLGLLVSRLRGGGLVLAAGLLVAFSGVLLVTALRGLDIHCGCFGSAGILLAGSVYWAIVRNLLLLGVVAWLLGQERQALRSQRS